MRAAGLAGLAQAALYYEAALDQLVSPERRGATTYWCQSLRAGPGLRGLSLGTCLGLLKGALHQVGAHQQGDKSQDGTCIELLDAEGTAAVRALVQTVNLFPAASAYGKAHRKKKDFIRGKVYKWDFSGMLPLSGGGGGPRGTVEFRQAPGSRSAEDGKGWASVVLTLVACVTSTSSTAWMMAPGNFLTGGSLEELWGVLGLGAEVLGWEDVGAAAQIFAKRAP